MKIILKAFAGAREILGHDEETIELPEGATLAELDRLLARHHPELARLRLRYAINLRYAALSSPLGEGDEVGLIPPVGGG